MDTADAMRDVEKFRLKAKITPAAVTMYTMSQLRSKDFIHAISGVNGVFDT